MLYNGHNCILGIQAEETIDEEKQMLYRIGIIFTLADVKVVLEAGSFKKMYMSN